MRRVGLIGGLACAITAAPVFAKDKTLIRIGYISQEVNIPPALSNLDELPSNEGLAGAELGIKDNNTTGRFTKQSYELVNVHLKLDGDPAQTLSEMVGQGLGVIVLDLNADGLDKTLMSKDADQVLLINAGASDTRFRDKDCRANLLHSRPSRAMRTDALAQYLVKKRWTDLFLVQGPRPEDKLYADSVRKSAKKFGLKIVEEKVWTGEHDARRTAQAEIPVFTQGVDFDVLIVADEIGDYGDYLMYRTWTPRPVAGTQGLIAQAWGRPVEQWGAAQLQARFLADHGRWMLPRDFAAWAAVRSIGEAATRTKSGDMQKISDYIRSDKFQLAAFKGRKLSYRSWNGQLRQTIPLMTARSLVTQAPLNGFLHRRTELDTLGLDEPESQCSANK